MPCGEYFTDHESRMGLIRWRTQKVALVLGVPVPFLVPFLVGGGTLSLFTQMYIFAIAVLLSLGIVAVLMLFFRYTVTGSILRAAASDEQAAMVLGVSIERTVAVAWALSITITTIGGVLLATSSGGASTSIATTGIIILAAVVFGGLDSIPGAFTGAIVVGLLRELGSYYFEGGTAVVAPVVDVQLDFGPGFGNILPLILLLVVIVVKPYGLFGTERIERL